MVVVAAGVYRRSRTSAIGSVIQVQLFRAGFRCWAGDLPSQNSKVFYVKESLTMSRKGFFFWWFLWPIWAFIGLIILAEVL
jgi:hypothetical protein